MSKITLAYELSKEAHQNQKYGIDDYFEHHVKGVVHSLESQGFSEKHIIVAYLHDVVEDTSITTETISNLFGEGIAQAVDAITKRDGEELADYYNRCKKNSISRIVINVPVLDLT